MLAGVVSQSRLFLGINADSILAYNLAASIVNAVLAIFIAMELAGGGIKDDANNTPTASVITPASVTVNISFNASSSGEVPM